MHAHVKSRDEAKSRRSSSKLKLLEPFGHYNVFVAIESSPTWQARSRLNAPSSAPLLRTRPLQSARPNPRPWPSKPSRPLAASSLKKISNTQRAPFFDQMTTPVAFWRSLGCEGCLALTSFVVNGNDACCTLVLSLVWVLWCVVSSLVTCVKCLPLRKV